MQGLILDLDGTLIDGFAGIHDALMHTCRHFGQPEHDLSKTKTMVGHGLPLLLEKALGAARVQEALPVYWARYSEIVEDSAHPLPGAHELITRSGRPLVLASNKTSHFSERILRKLGWLDAFRAVLGPDKVGPPKPHPAMLHEAVRLLGNDVLYIGDMTVDLHTARAANVPVALVATGNMTRAELLAAGAADVFDDLVALSRWMPPYSTPIR